MLTEKARQKSGKNIQNYSKICKNLTVLYENTTISLKIMLKNSVYLGNIYGLYRLLRRTWSINMS